MSETLYKMTNEFMEIKAQLEEMEGLDPQTIEDTLEAYKGDLVNKAENVAKYIRTLEAQAEMKKAEAKRLTDAAKVDSNKAENLLKYLDVMMTKAELTELTAGIFSIKYKKGSEVVKVDESKLPSWKERKDLYDVKPIFKLTKPQLKEKLKKGEVIPGVSIERNPDKLVMK